MCNYCWGPEDEEDLSLIEIFEFVVAGVVALLFGLALVALW